MHNDTTTRIVRNSHERSYLYVNKYIEWTESMFRLEQLVNVWMHKVTKNKTVQET